jgi:hypothetical protein
VVCAPLDKPARRFRKASLQHLIEITNLKGTAK